MKNILSKKHHLRGFTVIELLIVIIVIGILASITYVSYTGVQTTSRTKQAQANAVLLQKKIEAYRSNNGNYPGVSTISAYTSALNGQADSSISNTAIVIAAALTTATASSDLANNQTTLAVSYCNAPNEYNLSSGATAYQIYYWDYGTKLPIPSTKALTNSTSTTACTSWVPLN